MKISSDFLSGIKNSIYENVTKNLMDLKSGDSFKAEVIDIKPDMVVLKLGDNSMLNAKTLVIPDLRIGQEAMFNVKENSSGQIFVEIAKDDNLPVNINIIREFLSQAGMSFTKENIELVKKLIENNFPADKNTLEKASFFRFMFGEKTDLNTKGETETLNNSNLLDKVLFMIKEKFPTSELSVNSLNNILSDKTNIKSELDNITEFIDKIEDKDVKEKLFNLFGLDKKNHNIEQLKKKLFLEIKDGKSLENINKKFETIYKAMKDAEKIIEDKPEYKQLDTSVKNVENSIDFMKHVESYKEFVQIPININNKNEQCDLYVFKNKKGGKNSDKYISALISINYTYLGRVETFIERSLNVISFQFRLENDNTLKTIKKHINELTSILNEKGYIINKVDYKKIDEPFTVVNDNVHKKEVNESKRYSFDMRV